MDFRPGGEWCRTAASGLRAPAFSQVEGGMGTVAKALNEAFSSIGAKLVTYTA